MEVPICEYIKTGGKRCGSPALSGFKNCYYHERLRQAMPMTTLFMEQDPNAPPGVIPHVGFDTPLLDDGAAIQIGFMQLIHGVAHHRLDPRRAKLILSALHGASANLRQMDTAVAAASKPVAAALQRSTKTPKKQPGSVECEVVEAEEPA